MEKLYIEVNIFALNRVMSSGDATLGVIFAFLPTFFPIHTFCNSC
jgi:hypothetical protein